MCLLHGLSAYATCIGQLSFNYEALAISIKAMERVLTIQPGTNQVRIDRREFDWSHHGAFEMQLLVFVFLGTNAEMAWTSF